jgi:N-hydroxyarylamine O-acetyltransferase
MSDEISNLDSYLERIDYSGDKETSEETLRDLHIAHTLNVPFENLDVFYRKPVRLDQASLYRKIVENRRGGYCFEMNGIFSIALKRIGFKVSNLLARVTIDGLHYTAKTHQVILVEVGDKRWLADVGFGNDGIIAPLLLEEKTDQKQFAHVYRIIQDPKFGYVLQKKEVDNYRSLYAFTLDECYPEDFEMSNHYTATFPESFFMKMRMCTMPTKEGRITLVDNRFKTVVNGFVTEKSVKNEDEFKRYLSEYFRI